MKRNEENEQSTCNRWGCTRAHTHNTILNKRKNIALGNASFEVGICNMIVASVCFGALIDDS